MRQNGRHTHVRHGDARVTPLPACWCCVLFFFFFWFCDSCRLGLICTDLGQIGLYRAKPLKHTESADSGQNSKKKKRVQNTPFELNPKLSQLKRTILHFNLQLSLTLCALSPLSPLGSLLSISPKLSLVISLAHSLLRSAFSAKSLICEIVIGSKKKFMRNPFSNFFKKILKIL